MNKVQIDQPSIQSLLLNCRYKDQELSTATGFVVARPDGSLLLITNWHVVTGRNLYTRELLASTGAIPDRILIYHNKLNAVGTWIGMIELLYDESGNPRWLEHPQYGSQVDVVGLPLTNLKDVVCETYSYDSNPSTSLGPSDRVSIVGFPFGLTAGGAFGIWVQGSVASEPALNYSGLPCFLIDSRTRAGQSGSPVIVYSRSGVETSQVGGISLHGGPIKRLLGVYSGRITSESDLGMVWKTSIVKSIAESGVPGTES
jgi:hypothetical protein